MKRHAMRKGLLATTMFVGAAMTAFPACAQSADGGQDSGSDTVIVTGSRIPHPELESASPVTTVSSTEIQQSGATRIEDLLNALPALFAGQNGNISNGATGIATLDLRNLGPKRTLVLIDGRRMAPGDPQTPYADVNIIPATLVKRIDVLTGGASSVYGADAVGGVVNFVMDTDFNGFRVNAQRSFYMHDNRAGSEITDPLNARNFPYPTGNVTDGAALDASLAFGAGFDGGRGHITAYVGYRKINPVVEANRDYSSCTLSANKASKVAANGLYNCGGSGTSAPGSFYTGGAYYQVEGSDLVPGQELFNIAPYNYFQRPDERYTAGFFADYEVSDAFKPYAEFMFMDDHSVSQVAPSGDFFQTSSLNCDNPLLSAQQKSLICAPGNTSVGTDGVTRGWVYTGRRNVEGGPRQDDLQHTAYRGVIGAKGDFAKGLRYDAYYQYSRTNTAETYYHDLSITRMKNALDVVDDGSGNAVCRVVANGTDNGQGCVPWNIFTTGGVTQAALNYLEIPLFSRGQNTEQVAEGNVTLLGSAYGLVTPWASEGFALNVGASYRKQTLNYELDSNYQSGDGAGQPGPKLPVAGDLDVNEFYVESSLPIVQRQALFYDLRISAGYRRSHYTVNGNGVDNAFNSNTWKIGGSWSPVRDIKFRVSFNRAVRAPNVVELFSAQGLRLDGSTDPCAGALGSDGTPGGSGATLAQCQLTGVTAAQYGNIAANSSHQYNGLTGGNPNLNPEVSNSVTAGVVLTPGFLPGFQATVDYFNIRLKDRIGVIGADTIITQCLDGSHPEYCGLVHRNAGGNLWRSADGYIVDTNLNAGDLSTRGIDVQTAYNVAVGSGSINASIAGTYLDSLLGNDIQCAGLYGALCGTPSPTWRHKARLGYTFAQGVNVTGSWRYFSPVDDDSSTSAPGNARIPAVSYFDLVATVPIMDKFTLRAGANNILDKSPPINALGLTVIQNGNTFPQVYDALGRYVFVGITLDL